MRKAVCITLTLSLLLLGVIAKGFAAENNGKQTQSAGEAKGSPGAAQASEEAKMKEQAKKAVAARVNGTDISMIDVVQMMNRLSAGDEMPPSTPEGKQKLKDEAINTVVLQELAYQKAKAAGLKPEQKAIDESLNNLKTNLQTEEAYKLYLTRYQTTEDELKAAIEKSLTINLIYTKEVLDKVVVSEEDIKKSYEANKTKFFVPEKVSVVDVVFFLKPDDSKSLEKVDQMRRLIIESYNNDPWKLVLDGTFIIQPYTPTKEKSKELYEEAKKLKVGEISGVIKTPDSLHIIKLKDYSPERYLTLDEVKKTIELGLKQEAQKKRMDEWESELKKDAKIEIFEVKEGGQTSAAEEKPGPKQGTEKSKE